MNVWHSICKFVLTNPSVAIFLTLGLGYLLGRFHIKSFKLGATHADLRENAGQDHFGGYG